MSLPWKKSLAALLTGTLLVGCSYLTHQQRPEPGNVLDIREPLPLKPGVATVVVEELKKNEATVAWRSPWEGQSTVAYGQHHRLAPVTVERSAPTSAQRIVLTDLQPGTRYYFQVETATPLGVARSAVLSFRTR